MDQGLEWVAIDIVSACMESRISLNFRNDKRFYRIRLKDRCGIFDLRSHSFLETTSAIFSERLDKEYRLAGNDLRAIEAVAAQCLPELDDAYLFYNTINSEQKLDQSGNSKFFN